MHCKKIRRPSVNSPPNRRAQRDRDALVDDVEDRVAHQHVLLAEPRRARHLEAPSVQLLLTGLPKLVRPLDLDESRGLWFEDGDDHITPTAGTNGTGTGTGGSNSGAPPGKSARRDPDSVPRCGVDAAAGVWLQLPLYLGLGDRK